jgi:Family of unknown function (DUF5670)
MTTFASILVVLWILGCVSSVTMGGYLHLLLVIPIAVVLPRLVLGRKVTAV